MLALNVDRILLLIVSCHFPPTDCRCIGRHCTIMFFWQGSAVADELHADKAGVGRFFLYLLMVKSREY